MHESKKAIHFSFVGDVENIIPDEVKTYCTLYGHIKDEQTLHEIYLSSDVLILTSAYEGLPIVVMDMMARGKVIISTSVGGIPDYIIDGENGLLIIETEEEQIIRRGIELLELLIDNPDIRKKIGKRSYEYSLKHFSGEQFCNSYRKILLIQ